MSIPLWEKTRHALARLFAHAEIRGVPLSHLGPDLHFRHPPEIGQSESEAGAQEESWHLLVAMRTVPELRAETGSQEASLLPCTLVVQGLAGWGTQGCLVKAVPLQRAAATVVIGAGKHWLRATALKIRGATLSVREPACHVSQRLPALLKILPLRRELWAHEAARIQTGLSPLASVPLTRLRLSVPVTLNKALAAGRKQLAMASDVPLEDLILIGLYPDMPVAAVKRLAVEDSGRALRFWLKPELMATLALQKRVILVIGRRRSSGQIVQMVL